MSTIADLFAVQKEIMENLNKLYINFKKEGKERKTSESIKRRLQSLETLWRDFSRNHDNLVKLCDETEDNEYFGDDSYIKTKTFYNDVKKHLLRVLEETTTRSPSPKNQPPTPSSHSTTVPLPSTSDHDFPSSGTVPKKVLPLPRFVFHDVDKPNKVEEMMRKQQSNFKALARTISQINLNVLSEKWEFKDVLKTIESRWAAIDSLHWEIDSNLQGEDKTVRRKTETNKNTQPFHNPQKHSNQILKRKNPRDSGFNNANRHDEYKPFINHSAIKPYQKCLICDENHALFICNKFRELNNQEKRKNIAQNNICKNCLINHNGKECTSQKTCRHCHEKHNSLLHNAYVITNPVTNQTHTNQHKQPKCVSHVSKDNEPMTDILLATAQVNVLGADGTYKTMRALIDQGSQTSIISENAAQQLGIHRRRCKGSIFGIGAKESNCKGVMTITSIKT
ncbi:hypothetical protein SFRURICE_004186 [Spodoptera frugiperda]|nr:hypothetical protein SFRURICE_004186 [Spodoptera frugiperda]